MLLYITSSCGNHSITDNIILVKKWIRNMWTFQSKCMGVQHSLWFYLNWCKSEVIGTRPSFQHTFTCSLQELHALTRRPVWLNLSDMCSLIDFLLAWACSKTLTQLLSLKQCSMNTCTCSYSVMVYQCTVCQRYLNHQHGIFVVAQKLSSGLSMQDLWPEVINRQQ